MRIRGGVRMGWVYQVVSLDGEYGRGHTQDGTTQARQPVRSEVLKHDGGRKQVPVGGELRRVAGLDVDFIGDVDLDESQIRSAPERGRRESGLRVLPAMGSPTYIRSVDLGGASVQRRSPPPPVRLVAACGWRQIRQTRISSESRTRCEVAHLRPDALRCRCRGATAEAHPPGHGLARDPSSRLLDASENRRGVCHGSGNAIETIGLGGRQILRLFPPGKRTVRDTEDRG